MDERWTIDADDLAELDTAVGLAGTVRQAEVGGHVCFDVVIAIACTPHD